MENKHNVYLFGVYDSTGTIRAIKVGETNRTVEVRRQEVQRHANKSPQAYNKGLHVTLAYVETDGIDGGKAMESGVHKLIQEMYSDIVRFPHSKDYFNIPYGMDEKVLIRRFDKCAKEYGKRNEQKCI